MNSNERIKFILGFIEAVGEISIAEIIRKFESAKKPKISKITINRDLEKLVEQKWIIMTGKGPAVRYKLSSGYLLFKEYDLEEYFRNEEQRSRAKESFNFDIFNLLSAAEIFNPAEKDVLRKNNTVFQHNIKSLTPDIIKREYERLMIELSWKSSKIEGNTYSLLETENLIKNHQEASGHTKEEAQMILNHKEALFYINQNKENFKKISVSKIEEIHSLLIQGMGIEKNIRKRIVRITGTKYAPLDNEFQIREALEKTCKLVNKKEDVFSKSLLLNLLIAYIQSFNDGNKRASRLTGNAVLMAYGACPLSFRSINELEYKKAMILFYEQNNLRYFKELFIEQYEFAVGNYFR